MSENEKEAKSGFVKEWLAPIGSTLGLFSLLVALIIKIQVATQDPQTLRAVSIAGYILYILITLWVLLKAENVKPRLRSAILIILYIATAAYFFWMGTWVRISSISDWPPKLISYYDFETDADLEGWVQQVERSKEHVFSGQYALKTTLPVQADQETKISLTWQQEFTADVVIGQIYWPSTEDVSIVWATVCVPLENWACAGLLEKKGGWDTFVLDLSEMEVGNPPRKLNGVVLPGLHFQGRLRGTTGTQVSTIPMYVDTIQIYRDGRE